MESNQKTLPNITIQDILVNRRSELGLTHSTIASYMGIRSPEFIGMVERGNRGFDLNKIPLLADILNFERADLVKIYLAEEFPVAYDALFTSKPGEIKTNYATRSEAQELLDLYQELPKERREQTMSNLRVEHRKKIGKM